MGKPFNVEGCRRLAQIASVTCAIISVCRRAIRRARLSTVPLIRRDASAVLPGRATPDGLAAHGESGVTGVLDLLLAGMDRALALIGGASIAELRSDDLRQHH